MTEQTTAIAPTDQARAVVNLVLDGLSSQHSRRAYGKALADFLQWHSSQGRPALSKALVQAYKVKLEADKLAPSTINLRLAAIRKLAAEASDNALLDPILASGVKAVKGVKTAGVRAGNWLTKEQAQRLLNTPDVATVKGLRDRAVLAVLIGCGLRRSEAAALTCAHLQQREGRWCIVDLVGKGNRTRTVPAPSWTKAAIDAWLDVAGIAEGRVFRAVNKAGEVTGQDLTDQAIFDVVGEYAAACGLGHIGAHDLRRTFAKLAHRGGAALDQVQLSLGHSSIQTTERYLGLRQDLTSAPCDFLGLRLGAEE